MKLPELSTPVYEVKLLSKDKPVRFRPFLVKEQKLMMMASEAKDPLDTVNTLKRIAENCILDEINVDDLPLVDLEILFLNLRARSMGEIIDVYYKCKNEVRVSEESEETKSCDMILNLAVNLLEVPVINEHIERRIMVSDEVGIQMKLPTFKFINEILNDTSDSEKEEQEVIDDADYKAAAMCIDYIFDNDTVYYAKDATLDEMMNFIYSLPVEHYEKIQHYFENLPTVRKEIKEDCPKCGFKHDFVLEGLNDFFI